MFIQLAVKEGDEDDGDVFRQTVSAHILFVADITDWYAVGYGVRDRPVSVNYFQS
jgi:hypothetical protein